MILEDNSEFLDMFGNTEYKRRSKKNIKKFLPWHRLRKQVVREMQWCESVKPLIQNLKEIDRPLKYLGLPGTDLLDIRLLHQEICIPKDIELFFLGFNTDADPENENQIEADISLEEVKQLSHIDPASKIRSDMFETISAQTNMAHQVSKKHAPYDIVNIDLCDGFAKEKPGLLGETMYNAITEVIGLQEKTRDPWVLFLTTRVDKKSNSPATFDRLQKIYDSNVESCPSFKSEVNTLFGANHMDLSKANTNSPKNRFNIFTTGISKWLISLGLGSSPSWDVEVLNSFSYQVWPKNPYPDLVSLAYKFTPRVSAPVDKFKLANAESTKTFTECELATKVVTRILNTMDCDKALREDPEFLESMAETCSSLMEQARYDKDAFRAWATDDAK